MYKKLILITVLVVFNTIIAAQSSPKREFRAAWIATVTNLDWPPSVTNIEAQKTGLVLLLDSLKNAGINAVIFQVRSECDAMYQSSIEPWSYWLTGAQGRAPNPFYDPLELAITEAHKRGMELHAWFNPYRAVRSVGSYSAAYNHVSVLHPDWLITMGGISFLDPGLPMVRDYVVSVIMDVTRRYDIDGIHMDDYFYPYPPPAMTTQDDSTFAHYPRGFTNRGDWRRDNVNLLIKQINDSVHAAKQYVKFGMSPFGIWKSGIPAGTSGLSAYYEIYCDAITWLQKRSIDYLTPQIYWKIGGSQDYQKIMNWWADSVAANGRHFYPGQAPFNITSLNWSSSELPNQIRMNRANPKTMGSVFFRTGTLIDNPKGFTDSLRNNIFRFQALRPIMNWKDNVKPNSVRNLQYSRVPGTSIAQLNWKSPATASDGDSAKWYAVYRFTSSSITQSDIDNPENLVDITGLNFLNIKKASTATNWYYGVTALDRNSNESQMSALVQIPVPAVPILQVPENSALNQRDTVKLKWNYAEYAGGYNLQFSSDSLFQTVQLSLANYSDTVYSITGLQGQAKYFWRLAAQNATGVSAYSQVFSFFTGFPRVAVMQFPSASLIGVSPDPLLKWARQTEASAYHIQLAHGMISPQTLILDTVVAGDTSLQVHSLVRGEAYFWSVAAMNQYGMSAWAQQRGFRIGLVKIEDSQSDIPHGFALYQNYPNPFNPSTRIEFDVANSSLVRIAIYDILGNEIAMLAHNIYQPGHYSVNWNGKTNAGFSVPSGVYFCRMHSEGFIKTMKLILQK